VKLARRLRFLKQMLGTRITAGAALAGLPLALALTAAAQSWPCWLITLSGAVLAAVLLLTGAPWLPLLHQLPPPIGAPKAKITFRQVPQNEHRYPPSTVIVEVGIKPTTRLDDAVVNFRFPREGFSHASLYVRDPAGNRRTDGQILPPRDITSSSPVLWWSAPADIRAASMMFWFQLAPSDPDQVRTFKVTMLVSSEKLHGSESKAEYEISYLPPPQELSGERDG
jgi:hypothetical protein